MTIRRLLGPLALSLAIGGCAVPDVLGPTDSATAAASAPRLDCPAPPPAGPSSSPAAWRPPVLAESTGEEPPMNGSARLCIGGEYVADAGGFARCDWSEGGFALRSILAPLVVDGVEVVAVTDLDPALPPTITLAYDGGRYTTAGQATVRDDPAGLSGTIGPVELRLERPVDAPAPRPLGGPAGPAAIVAVVRWSCQPPPSPEPGLASGTLQVRIGQPVDREFTTQALCRWTSADAQWAVVEVSGTHRGMVNPGLFASPVVSIHPGPIRAQLLVTRAGHERHGEYRWAEQSRAIPIDLSPDSARGRILVRGLALERGNPDESQPIVAGTADVPLSIDVAWQCDRPPVAPRPAVEPLEHSRNGAIRLTLRGPINAAAQGGMQCLTLAGSPLEAAWGSVDLAGERWLVDANGQTFRIVRLGADGRVLGEYARPWTPWETADEVVLHDTFLRLSPPPDVQDEPAPLGGQPAGHLAFSFELDCREP